MYKYICIYTNKNTNKNINKNINKNTYIYIQRFIYIYYIYTKCENKLNINLTAYLAKRQALFA